MDHRPDGISAPTDDSSSSSSPLSPAVSSSASTRATGPTTHTSASALPTYPSLHQHVPAPMMDLDNHSPVNDRSRRATSVLSMDDLEAAQALEGLRSDFTHHSPRASQHLSSHLSDSQHPEPILSLLTSSHPLISSAINGSVSAYTSSKTYSPRFKSGAEFIERNIGSPVANTVGSVGRKTGVESGLRWALQRKASDSKKRSKRRKVSGDKHPTTSTSEVDVEKALEESTMAQAQGLRSPSELSMAETLPPYDDLKSPNYEDIGRRPNPTWQSRLMISTSGLGVAMSDESLRSLQYCVTWLRWANGRLGKAIYALQGALKEWDTIQQQQQDNADDTQNRTLLSQRIQAVKDDVLNTLKQAVNVVSKYAGGALPDNARSLVRRHLTSLPHRFQVAFTSHPPPDSPASGSDATVGAHRILVLAQEGLDMMGQVSGVVNDTLVSAEHWCERLGRKRSDAKDAGEVQQQQPEGQADVEAYPVDVKEPVVETQDITMTGTDERV